MRDIWNFVRCMQPAYNSLESIGISHQIYCFTASIGLADLATFPPKMAILLQQIQGLPTELQFMILKFTGPCLGLSLITVLLDTLPLIEKAHALKFSDRQLIPNFDKIYVRYGKIRGQSYVTEISNHWRTHMHKIPRPSDSDHIVLSLDDLGIRDICFSSKGSSSRPTKAPWYQHEKLGSGDQTMLVTKNVRPARDFYYFANSLQQFLVKRIVPLRRDAVKYLWDLPRVPNISEHQWYEREDIVTRPDSDFHMRHVDLHERVTGLTVACHTWTNVGFYVHHVNGSKTLTELRIAEAERTYGNELVWIYFPMSPGERICGFWVLRMLGVFATVAVRTSFPPSSAIQLTMFRSTHHMADPAFLDLIRNLQVVTAPE